MLFCMKLKKKFGSNVCLALILDKLKVFFMYVLVHKKCL